MWLEGVSFLMKILIFVFNLLFVIFGIVLISVGAVIKAEYASYSWFLDDRFFSVPALLIAIGVIIFVVAFFGCCGVVKENYCMVVTFSVLMVLLFILELSAGIAGYVLRDNAEQFITYKMKASMQYYNVTGGSGLVWTTVQRTFHCCGVNSPLDWNNGTLPASCCYEVTQQWGGNFCDIDSTNLNHQGCLGSLEQFVKSHAATLGGIGIAIAIIQLLGMVFACTLSKNIRNSSVSV